MKDIILKAKEGGWSDRLYRNLNNAPENDKAGIEIYHRDLVLDPLFWQALGKSCPKFSPFEYLIVGDQEENKRNPDYYISFALRFHEINLSEGWDKAIEYLESLIK